MIFCHIDPKKLIKLSFRNNFDIIGDDTTGHYSWAFLYSGNKPLAKDKNDVVFLFFHIHNGELSHKQTVHGVTNSVIENHQLMSILAMKILVMKDLGR